MLPLLDQHAMRCASEYDCGSLLCYSSFQVGCDENPCMRALLVGTLN